MKRVVFYVDDFPDLKADTPITITIPRNAGRRFAVEIDLPTQILTQNQALASLSPEISLSPIRRSSLSPGDNFYSPPERLSPEGSRTALGIDGTVDAARVTSPRSPLLYRSPPERVSPRQPTLLEAMRERQTQDRSPGLLISPSLQLSPGYIPDPNFSPDYRYRTRPNSVEESLDYSSDTLSPYQPILLEDYGRSINQRVSPTYVTNPALSPRNLSAILPSPEILPGPPPTFRGDTNSFAATSPCLSPYVNRNQQLDSLKQYSPEGY